MVIMHTLGHSSQVFFSFSLLFFYNVEKKTQRQIFVSFRYQILESWVAIKLAQLYTLFPLCMFCSVLLLLSNSRIFLYFLSTDVSGIFLCQGKIQAEALQMVKMKKLSSFTPPFPPSPSSPTICFRRAKMNLLLTMQIECEGNREKRCYVLGEASVWIMKSFVVGRWGWW